MLSASPAMPAIVNNVIVHILGTRNLPRPLSGRTDAGGGWLRVQLGQSGVLLLRRLGPGGPGEWRSPCSGSHSFGHAHLPNSGHCVAAYLFADLYVGTGRADYQFSLVIPLKGVPNTDSVRDDDQLP
jgi:hypothetical protein